jgi:hypothetical protein
MTHHCIKPWWKRLRFGEIGWQPVIFPARWGIECKSPEVEKYLRNIRPDSEAGGYLFVSGIDLDVRAVWHAAVFRLNEGD